MFLSEYYGLKGHKLRKLVKANCGLKKKKKKIENEIEVERNLTKKDGLISMRKQLKKWFRGKRILLEKDCVSSGY